MARTDDEPRCALCCNRTVRQSLSLRRTNNATLLDQEAISFLTQHGVSIGLSLDAPTAAVSDPRPYPEDLNGSGVFSACPQSHETASGIWRLECHQHDHRQEPHLALPAGRTLPCRGRTHLHAQCRPLHAAGSPRDQAERCCCAARAYLKALDRSREFMNRPTKKWWLQILPTSCWPSSPLPREGLCATYRRAAGGRCFFALAPNGDAFPCSEFYRTEGVSRRQYLQTSMDSIIEQTVQNG